MAALPPGPKSKTVKETGDASDFPKETYEPGNPAAVAESASKADPPIVVTTEQVEALFLASDVTTEDPWTALGRLGLVLATEEEAQ